MKKKMVIIINSFFFLKEKSNERGTKKQKKKVPGCGRVRGREGGMGKEAETVQRLNS